MRRRAKGLALVEVVAALTLGVVFISVFAARLGTHALELRHSAEDARARAALLVQYERLQAGLLPPPAPGAATVLASEGGLTVSIERLEAPASVTAHGALVPVLLRARWKAHDGRPRTRELATLAGGNGS